METELTKSAFLCFSNTTNDGTVCNYVPCFCDRCNGNKWVVETVYKSGKSSYYVVYVSMPMLVMSFDKKVKLDNVWLSLPKMECIVERFCGS